MSDSLLTVAIPTYRGAGYLAQALRSILAQEGVGFDVLVSDDRSDDETLGIVRSEAGDRVRIFENSERLGLAGNWNQCVARSRTPFVAVFHQDDVMRPGHLAAHLAAFAASDRIGLVASAADVVDEQGKPVSDARVVRGGLGVEDRRFGPGEAIPLMVLGNPLRCSAVSLRKEAITSVGAFDPSYRYVLDWDAWLKIARRWEIAWKAHPTVAIRWHSASETHRFKTGTADLDESARLLAALFAQEAILPSEVSGLRQKAKQALSRAFLTRAHEALRSGDGALARRCLWRAWQTWRGIAGVIVADPRLAAQFAAILAAPDWAARRLKRS